MKNKQGFYLSLLLGLFLTSYFVFLMYQAGIQNQALNEKLNELNKKFEEVQLENIILKKQIRKQDLDLREYKLSEYRYLGEKDVLVRLELPPMPESEEKFHFIREHAEKIIIPMIVIALLGWLFWVWYKDKKVSS